MTNLDRIATIEYRIEREKEIIKSARKAKCSQEFIKDCKRSLLMFQIELAALQAVAA